MNGEGQETDETGWLNRRKSVLVGAIVFGCLAGVAVVQWSSASGGTVHDLPGCQASSPGAEFEVDFVYLNGTHEQTRLMHVGGDPIPAHEMYVSFEDDDEWIPLSRATSGDPPRGNITIGDDAISPTRPIPTTRSSASTGSAITSPLNLSGSA